MEHGFQFSSSILETLDKTTACIVFGTWGILGTVIGFGVVRGPEIVFDVLDKLLS